jgi:hypothetical protein
MNKQEGEYMKSLENTRIHLQGECERMASSCTVYRKRIQGLWERAKAAEEKCAALEKLVPIARAVVDELYDGGWPENMFLSEKDVLDAQAKALEGLEE